MADLLANLGARELAARLRDGAVSAAELGGHFTERARARADLNAILRFVEAGDGAALSDDAGAKVEWGAAADAVALLRGIPIAHKDIFCAKGALTTCGSKILENFVSPYDSAVVSRCRAAGLTTIARANMDEFAMGSSGEHSAFGATLNPWDKTRVPGGSSSGSAAAVAARLAPLATATDTGGSIRQPAAFCGITGIRPTYGRVSRWGMVAFASSFDQGGVLAKSADDCALALSAMAGFDERDSTSLKAPPEDFTRDIAAVESAAAAADKPLAGRVIGLPKEFFAEGLDNAVAARVQEAAQALQALGATLKEVSLPSLAHAISAYYVLTCAEASSNLSRYDGVRYGHRAQADDLTAMYEKTRGEGFGREVKRRILIGAYMLSYGYYDAYYRRAMKVRKLIADDFSAAFAAEGGGCDALLGPTTPGTAFALGAIGTDDPVAMYLQDIYTVPVNLAGLPAMSVPCGFADGLPVGLHLIGAPMSEARLLGMAHAYQMRTNFHLQMPPEGA